MNLLLSSGDIQIRSQRSVWVRTGWQSLGFSDHHKSTRLTLIAAVQGKSVNSTATLNTVKNTPTRAMAIWIPESWEADFSWVNLDPFDDELSDVSSVSSVTSYTCSEDSYPDLFKVTESVTLVLVLLGSQVQVKLEVDDPWLGLGEYVEQEQRRFGKLSAITEEEEGEADDGSECETIGAHFGPEQERPNSSCEALEWSLSELKRRVEMLRCPQVVKQVAEDGDPSAGKPSVLWRVWNVIKSKMLCAGGCTGTDD